MCSICQFLWCKYSHHGQFQATEMTFTSMQSSLKLNNQGASLLAQWLSLCALLKQPRVCRFRSQAQTYTPLLKPCCGSVPHTKYYHRCQLRANFQVKRGRLATDVSSGPIFLNNKKSFLYSISHISMGSLVFILFYGLKFNNVIICQSACSNFGLLVLFQIGSCVTFQQSPF